MSVKGWARSEVEATVSDYFEMLRAELAGVRFNKAARKRILLGKLNSRSGQSVEYKRANISAALIDLGCQYVTGYKPRSNYQRLLLDVVSERLVSDHELRELASVDAVRPMVAPEVDNLLDIVQDPPKTRTLRSKVADPSVKSVRRIVDYVEREARNQSLGLEGEKFILRFEETRLSHSNRGHLASKIEHTSKVKGDGEGYDILSFNDDGSERLIEVKTTKYGLATPFFVSRNEISRSEQDREMYHVYRLFDFRETPGMYSLQGAISDTCELQAQSFVARPGVRDA